MGGAPQVQSTRQGQEVKGGEYNEEIRLLKNYRNLTWIIINPCIFSFCC